MQRLSNTTIAELPPGTKRPIYLRSDLKTGIVHLGIGAFHRAHQAVYTEAALNNGDLRWGIAAASLRSAETNDALAPQDRLYTVAVRDAAGDRLQVIGGLTALFVAPDNPAALLEAMTQKDVKIISLTVTEKGYCHDPATGKLREDHPDILHDLANPNTPRSAVGFIVAAIARRRITGAPAITLLTCDNLPENGHTLKRVVTRFAELLDPELAQYIAANIPCPCTMVDRIVPATTDADRAQISLTLGAQDAWPVVTEPFTQWVIEDNFASGRPDWALTGAQFVKDAKPYETMKLRLLNGAHSSIAYVGYLSGYETVSDAIADPDLRGFIERLMREEIATTLHMPDGTDVGGYIAALLARFENPALRHRTWQIAMDGSQKLPQRLLGTIRDRLAQKLPIDGLALAVAAWMRYIGGVDENGNEIDVRDPLKDELRQHYDLGSTPGEKVANLVNLQAIFGDDLKNNAEFMDAVGTRLEQLLKNGTKNTFSPRS